MVTQLEIEAGLVTTGNEEVDKKLGGGIPVGSLVLLEGQSDAGKSVVSQHFAHGALRSNLGTVYYTSETTVKNLISQMNSLELDVTDYFLCDRLRVYPVLCNEDTDSTEAFGLLLDHFRNLPVTTRLIIVDSLTGMASHGDERSVIDFFAGCKQLCDYGKTIICVVHSDALDDQLLIRIRSLCDAHLTLRLDQVRDRLVKLLEVAKVRNSEQTAENFISFDVEPGLGMRVIPLAKAKA